MGKYTVTFSRKAQKKLNRLSDNLAEPILNALASLADNPRPNGYIKLKGFNAYRIRVGSYRIIYEIFDRILVVEIIDLGDRKDIYG